MHWLLGLLLLVAEPENQGCLECNVTVFELRYQGDTLSDYDTIEECEGAMEDIEPQTPPFTKLECVETWIQRYEG